MDKNIFNERFKQLRHENNITLEDLAKTINISSSTLQRYENNLIDPGLSKVLKIANYFDVTVDYLLGITDIKNIYKQKNKIKKHK